MRLKGNEEEQTKTNGKTVVISGRIYQPLWPTAKKKKKNPFRDGAGAHSGCSSVTDERSPQDWSNSHWIIEHSSIPKVKRCMEVFSLRALTKREEGLMKHGGMLTSHPSQCLPVHTEAGLDFRPGGFVVPGQGSGDWAILQMGVIRVAMIVSRVF